MFDLATARVRIGLQGSDTSKDTLLTAALDAALAMAETYCDRQFKQLTSSVSLFHFEGEVIQLQRYPVTALTSLAGDSTTLANYHLDGATGRIVMDGCRRYHQVDVSFTGGYATYPADLELAFWVIFDGIWPSVSGAAAAAGGGAIKAIRSNGASVEYDTSSASAGGLPLASTFILDKYRLVRC